MRWQDSSGTSANYSANYSVYTTASDNTLHWDSTASASASNDCVYLTVPVPDWHEFPTMTEKFPHELHEFRYVHQKKTGLSPTENLAPLFEEVEFNGRQALRHLRRLLRNPKYRAWQLKQINAINKEMGLPTVEFDEEAVRRQLKRYYVSPKELRRIEEEQRIKRQAELRANRRAKQLLKLLSTLEQKEQLEKERRIEIIARNGNVYEVLETGKVNKLLPDGKKEGLCVVYEKRVLPIHDIILAQKTLLEADPEKFEEVAHKTTPFILAP